MASTLKVTEITTPDGTGNITVSRPLSSVQLGGVLDVNGNYVQTEKGGDIASASPLVIDTDGDYFDVTGTTNFAAMTVAADRQFTLQFDGALTMTHHATNLDLPGEANITTAAGDVAIFQSTGANTVQCISYVKADGTAVVSSGLSNIADSGGDDVAIATGNLVISTSGKGIDFSATGDLGGMTNELLDDYEEGTWTPDFRGTTGSAGTSATSTGNGAKYIKIGNMCIISSEVLWTNKGSWTGLLQMEGLPFTSAVQTGSHSVGYHANITTTDSMAGYLQGSVTRLLFETGTTRSTTVTVANCTATCYITFTLVYMTA